MAYDNSYQAVKNYEQMMAALKEGRNYGSITPEYLDHFSKGQLREMAQAPYYYNMTFTKNDEPAPAEDSSSAVSQAPVYNGSFGLGYGYAQSYTDMLKEAQQAQLKLRAEALEAEAARLLSGKADIDADSDAAKRETYRNARLSARGNNELLADMGLAGNLYTAPKSGYSETSRISEDNALRSNLATIDAARIKAKNEVDLAISKLRSQGEKEKADLIAKHASDLISLMLRQI